MVIAHCSLCHVSDDMIWFAVLNTGDFGICYLINVCFLKTSKLMFYSKANEFLSLLMNKIVPNTTCHWHLEFCDSKSVTTWLYILSSYENKMSVTIAKSPVMCSFPPLAV